MTGLKEREIIRILTKQFSGHPDVPLGYDDDVSAIPLSSKTWILTKTDMLVGSTDVPPGMSLRLAARKAVVAVVSDFAAKGVQPRALMASLGLPAPVEKSSVQAIARGLEQAAREYDCKIIGGDTSQAKDLIIEISGIGVGDPEKLVRRDGARPGDVVAVTGAFGKSSAGLRILLSKSKRDLARFSSLVRAVLYPMARLKEGISLASSRAITSSIDSSDGLAWSLHEISRLNGVGIRLDHVPIDRHAATYAREKRVNPLDLALYGGEEYEIVTMIKPERFPELKLRFPFLLAIGKVIRGDGVTANMGGRIVRVQRKGWEHFAT